MVGVGAGDRAALGEILEAREEEVVVAIEEGGFLAMVDGVSGGCLDALMGTTALGEAGQQLLLRLQLDPQARGR